MRGSVLLVAAGVLGCASRPLPLDPNVGDPPPGPYVPGQPRYGTSTGAVTGSVGLAAASAGAQMLRDDDELFDRLGKRKRPVGYAASGAGAAFLGATLLDAAAHDNRNRLAERLEESGELDRLFGPRDVPPAAP